MNRSLVNMNYEFEILSMIAHYVDHPSKILCVFISAILHVNNNLGIS